MVTAESTDEKASPSLPSGLRHPRVVQTMLFAAYRRRMYWHCRRRFGETFTVRITGGQNLVSMCRPEDIREVLAGSAARFHAGKGHAILAPVLGENSVLLTDEAVNLRGRRLIAPVFGGTALRGYREMMTHLAAADAGRWPTGRPFSVHPRMSAVTLEIILQVVFGISDDERLAQLRPTIRRIPDVGPVTVLGWIYPPLRLFGPWKHNWQNLRAADRLLYAEIADRRRAGNLAERSDVLSRLLTASGDEFSDVELRDHMITLLIAGHETTATALAWAFHELARWPQVQTAAQQAADSGDDGYLEAFMKEVLRLQPIVPNLTRTLTEPTSIAGHHLPAGTVVSPSAMGVHRDASVHPDPEAFRPERFIGRQPAPGTWIPFGGGIRRCLGVAFALQESVVILREVLTRYDLHPTRQRTESPTTRNLFLAPSRGARIVAVPRA